jgi:hypothetical protein
MRRLRMSDVQRQAFPCRIRSEDLAGIKGKALDASERFTPGRLARWCLASSSPRYAGAQVRGATMDVVAAARPLAYAWEFDDQIHEWIRLAQQGQTIIVDALLYPDGAARRTEGHSQAVGPGPGYPPILARARKHAGWRRGLDYTVLVRPQAESVSDTSFAPARA